MGQVAFIAWLPTFLPKAWEKDMKTKKNKDPYASWVRELLMKIGKLTAPQRKHWFDKRVGIMLKDEKMKK